MIQLEEYNPWAEVVGKFGAGLQSGMSQSRDYAHKLGMIKETSRLKSLENKRKEDAITEQLMKHGVDEDTARLYSKFTTGGQTEFAKDILEMRRRGGTPSQFKSKIPSSIRKISSPEAEGKGDNLEGLEAEGETVSPQAQEKMPVEEKKTEKFDPLEGIEEFVDTQEYGLTPKERVSRETERFKINEPKYSEAGSKLRRINEDKYRIKILEDLNRTGKLPKAMGRINLDKEGNLKFPFAASPESQRYIKTLNEFSAGAKDTYGSRVTNFELGQFLKRYPNLLNTEEGRKQIIQQMKIINDINAVYYKNLKKVYDRAGGIRKIDPDVADRLAEEITEPQVDNLVKKFETIGAFESEPSAEMHPGRKIRNTKTGEVFESNGKEWVPIKE